MTDQPSIFISYSHADEAVAQALASELEARGFRVWIDERELRVGDSIIERIATAVAETDFFLALVSTASIGSRWCQKELHLAITGELGREGVKVLPVRVGDVEMPETLRDLLYLDLNPQDLEPGVARLVRDVAAHRADRPQSPPRVSPPSTEPAESSVSSDRSDPEESTEPIRIVGVVREGIGEPLDDGSAGSALYRVPLRLSRHPSELWTEVFDHEWKSQLYTMLREAHVEGDTIVFPSTTMDEIERHHLGQLRQVLSRVNTKVDEIEQRQRESARIETERRAQRKREHEESIERIVERLKFEE